MAPCESPSGLAFDSTKRRLFSVCDNKTMAVVDADSGKIIGSVPVGEGPDAAAFDEGTKLAFSSNGQDGTLTVIRQTGDSSYAVAETVPTLKSARTMALDPTSHKIYLSTALFGPAKASAGAHSPPSVIPGSFKVIVMAK